MAKSILAIAVVCLGIGGAFGVQFKDCGSKKGKVTSLDIPGCAATGPCDLHKGTNATISIQFSTAEQVTKITAVVHGVLAHIPVPFPLDNPDGCKDSGLTCPLSSGGAFKYSTVIEVKTSYPSVRLVIKWELKDQNGDDIICLELPAQIVSGAAKQSENAISYHPRMVKVV